MDPDVMEMEAGILRNTTVGACLLRLVGRRQG